MFDFIDEVKDIVHGYYKSSDYREFIENNYSLEMQIFNFYKLLFKMIENLHMENIRYKKESECPPKKEVQTDSSSTVVYLMHEGLQDEKEAKELLRLTGLNYVIFNNQTAYSRKIDFTDLKYATHGFVYVSINPVSVYMLVNLKKYNFKAFFMNHGWGTKKILSDKYYTKQQVENCRTALQLTDYIICYSEFDKNVFQHEALNDLPMPEFVPLGNPRNDYLVANKGNKDLILTERKKLGIPSEARVILIAPTFRDFKEHNEKISELYVKELEKLQARLPSDFYIIFRPHQYLPVHSTKVFLNERIFIAGKDRFRSPQVLMLISDMLITDYSSIFVDYLLLDKPIAFFLPDIDLYQQMRGLIIDPENELHMPGPKLNSLVDVLGLTEEDFMKYDYSKSKNFFHRFTDANATIRIAEFIRQVLKNTVNL